MKNILLPTDFSENAMNGVLYALDMYHSHNCRFILLNAYRVNGYESQSKLSAIPDQRTLDKARKESEGNLEDLIHKINFANRKGENEFLGIASNQPLIEAIDEQIERYKVEVVVIGTQGISNSYETIYGSNTIDILENVRNCPILAVPSHASFRPIREIVFPDSFKVRHGREDINYILQISQEFTAPIRVLHIEDNGGLTNIQERNKKILALYLQDTLHSFHSLDHVSLPVGIYCFTESRNSDLIAFINRKHSFLNNLLCSPLYKNIGHYSQVPVMVVHPFRESNSDKK